MPKCEVQHLYVSTALQIGPAVVKWQVQQEALLLAGQRRAGLGRLLPVAWRTAAEGVEPEHAEIRKVMLEAWPTIHLWHSSIGKSMPDGDAPPDRHCARVGGEQLR